MHDQIKELRSEYLKMKSLRYNRASCVKFLVSILKFLQAIILFNIRALFFQPGARISFE